MECQEIREILIQILTDVQVMSGHKVPDLTQDVRPWNDLEDFDSQIAEECATMLERRLGRSIDTNPFVSEDGRRAFKISEIVECLDKLSNQRAKSHAQEKL